MYYKKVLDIKSTFAMYYKKVLDIKSTFLMYYIKVLDIKTTFPMYYIYVFENTCTFISLLEIEDIYYIVNEHSFNKDNLTHIR